MGQRGSFGEKGILPGWILQIESNKGKRRGRLPKFRHTAPSTSQISLNGGVICGSLKILIKGFLIERELGFRVIYLKFKGFGFGWGALIGLP
jgi:hypothetical protein